MKPLYTEDDVQYTLRDIANGKSERKASLDWGVPRSTIQQRILGCLPRTEAHIYKQRLASVQEQRLTDWVLVQESLGQSPTYIQIRAFTGRILAAWHDAILLGKR
jgi:hypothetical protein